MRNRRGGQVVVTSRAEEEIANNMTAGTAANFLRQTALVLEERSRSLATRHARLRDHFDASLIEIEAAITSNKALQAETDAAVTNADTFRESLGNTYQVTAADVRAAALAAENGAGRRGGAVSHGEGQAAAAAAGGQEIGRATGALALLKQDAQEGASEADQQQLAEGRDAWAVWSGEWMGEAGSLVRELEVSGVQEGLDADRWKAGEEAAVVVRGREAELRNGLGAAQAAILALRSATGETARCSEAALDDMRDALATAQSEICNMRRDRDAALRSLLEVAHIRKTPGRLLPHQPGTSEGNEQEEDRGSCRGGYAGGAGSGSGRSGDMGESFPRWDPYPEHSAARTDNEESQARELTRLTNDDNDEEGRITFGDSSSCVRTPGAAALEVFEGSRRTSGAAEPATAMGRTREGDQAEDGDVVDCHTNSGRGESGEHVCGVCGTPAPSFRKLFDCRLSLRRAQAEAAEARAWALELEERTTTAVEDLVEENLAETVRKLEATFEVTREGLERRLIAAEARGREMGEKTAAAQREVAELVEAAGTREGEIAVLRTRLRAAEEDVGSARREALLEGSARSLAETEAAGRKAAQAWAGAVALKNKCRHQEQIIAGLALSRGEEADACRAARDELEKERSSRVESEGRVRELQGEVSSLASLLGAAKDEIERQRNVLREKEIDHHRRGQSGRGGGEAGGEALDRSASTQGVDDTDVCRYDGGETPTRRENQTRHHHTMGGRIEHGTTPESAWRGSCDNDNHVARRRQCDRAASTCSTPVASFTDRVGTREAKERERARKTLLALEESVRAAREEARHHKRRAERLRAALREAQERGEETEAAGSSARVAAEAADTAAGLAREEADTATAGKRKVEEDAASAARRHREEVEAIEAEVLRATAAALGANEQCSVAQGEAMELRETIRELDRRVILLEQQLGASIASVHAADAERVCALVGRIKDLGGREWEEEGRLEDIRTGYEADTGAVGGRMLIDPAGSGPGKAAQDLQEATRIGMRRDAFGNGDNRAGESEMLHEKSLRSNSASAFELATLRDRLTASQAQHVELVRASEAAVAGCNQRCDAHIRVVLAAGKLTAACLLRRGVVAGREAAVEAAGRLELARRCFRALREEALRASRDRSIRRQERLQRWIGEAFEGAGEEVESMATRKRSQQPRQQQHQPRPSAGVVVGQGYFRSSSDGCLSWEASQPLVLG